MATGKNGNGARLNGRASRSTTVRSDSRSRRKVRVAILGVGNCASSLVQGVEYYRDAKPGASIPGLMHVDLGGYHIRDIEFSAAFDIDKDKVGKDLSDAIFAGHNNTVKFADVPHLGVKVERGMTHDGLGKYLSEIITKAPGPTADIVGILKATRTDVVVNYLPVGSEEAVKWYAEQVLEAGCAFVNCMPVFLAREAYWRGRFEKRGIPIIGDDIKSQVGATIVHRVLTRLFEDRGVKLERTYQLNFGGNTDFLNMLERERLVSKKISKTNSVKSQMKVDIGSDNIHIGPSDYVPWLGDRKWAYIRLEGRSFGDVPLNVELKLEVWDSPNSAGVVIDAIRCCKLGLDRKLGGALEGPSSYFMKSPPTQVTDGVAHQLTEAFIAGTPADGKVTGRCAFYLMPRRRRVAFENFGQVLGLPWNDPLVKRTARHAFGNYFKMFADFMLMDTLTPEQIRRMVRPQGRERIDRALAEGKGVLVVTAHVSNWDILAAASAVYGYPISAVTNDLPSGGLNELVIASRERIGMKMIGLAPGSLRQIIKALGRNELVALASDLYSGDRGVRVPFFNRPAMFPSGPAALALKTGAPILPVWCRRQTDNLYIAEVEAPIEVSRTGDTQRDIQVTTERIVQFFERIIRREPDQWLVFLPVWRLEQAPQTPGSPMQPALDPS